MTTTTQRSDLTVHQIGAADGPRWIIVLDGKVEFDSQYLSLAAAQSAKERMIESKRKDIDHRASPAYAGWLKSIKPTTAELAEALRHHMDDQGDLA